MGCRWRRISCRTRSCRNKGSKMAYRQSEEVPWRGCICTYPPSFCSYCQIVYYIHHLLDDHDRERRYNRERQRVEDRYHFRYHFLSSKGQNHVSTSVFNYLQHHLLFFMIGSKPPIQQVRTSPLTKNPNKAYSPTHPSFRVPHSKSRRRRKLICRP